MSLYHVTINNVEREVVATSVKNAIIAVLNDTTAPPEPDECLNDDNRGITVLGEYAGEEITGA